MEEYTSNSHKSNKTKEKKKIEKVVKGEVITKKKTSTQKIADSLIGDEVGEVKSRVWDEIFWPSMKDILYEMGSSALGMFLGVDYKIGGSRRGSSSNRESYTKYYRSGGNKDTRDNARRHGRDRYNIDDVILGTRGEAEEVLDCLTDIVDQYGMASISDLYDLLGLESTYTNEKYGWYDLNTASVRPTREGYLIKLPRATLLD